MGSITVIFFWQFFFKIKGYFFKHALTDDKKKRYYLLSANEKKICNQKKKLPKKLLKISIISTFYFKINMRSLQQTPNFNNDIFSDFIKQKTKKLHFGPKSNLLFSAIT